MEKLKEREFKYYKFKPIKISKEEFQEMREYIFGKNKICVIIKT